MMLLTWSPKLSGTGHLNTQVVFNGVISRIKDCGAVAEMTQTSIHHLDGGFNEFRPSSSFVFSEFLKSNRLQTAALKPLEFAFLQGSGGILGNH